MAQFDGDSAQPLTVHSAAARIEALSSDPEETQDTTAETPAETEEKPSTDPAPDPVEDEADPADVDESETDEQTDEGETQAPQSFKVTLPGGEEAEVTLDELRKGYSRQQDYTRKTQAHADAVRAFESEKGKVLSERQQYIDGLSQLHETLTALTQEPDWDTLRQEDPAVFAQTHAAWQIHKGRLDAIKQERDRVAQLNSTEVQQAFAAHLQSEQEKLFAAVPELADPTTGAQAKKDLREYAISQGFSAEELTQAADHRAFILLHKAMLHDKAVAARAASAKDAQKKIEKVKTVAPGPAASSKPAASELTRRKQRLAKTGRLSDAAAALELLPDT